MSLKEVRQLLKNLSADEIAELLSVIRRDYGAMIHPLETEWNTTAEVVLQAIYEAPDLTQRGVRGILAEATFRTTVVPEVLSDWISIPLSSDLPYDLMLTQGSRSIRVQVKNQRKESGAPKIDVKLSRISGFPVFIVETQRTRNGQGIGEDGLAQATRPYRFGEFDVLAVCLYASSGLWDKFIYCPARRLLPRKEDVRQLKVMQPIFCDNTRGWTDDFDRAAKDALEMHSQPIPPSTPPAPTTPG